MKRTLLLISLIIVMSSLVSCALKEESTIATNTKTEGNETASGVTGTVDTADATSVPSAEDTSNAPSRRYPIRYEPLAEVSFYQGAYSRVIFYEPYTHNLVNSNYPLEQNVYDKGISFEIPYAWYLITKQYSGLTGFLPDWNVLHFSRYCSLRYFGDELPFDESLAELIPPYGTTECDKIDFEYDEYYTGVSDNGVEYIAFVKHLDDGYRLCNFYVHIDYEHVISFDSVYYPEYYDYIVERLLKSLQIYEYTED